MVDEWSIVKIQLKIEVRHSGVSVRGEELNEILRRGEGMRGW